MFQIMGRKFLDGFGKNCLDWYNGWTDDQNNELRENEVKKFLAVQITLRIKNSR